MPTNYNKLCGITLKDAKLAAKKILGRLPKCGYEVTVKTGIEDNKEYKVMLVNSAGSFYLYKWVSVNYTFLS